MPDKPIIFSAPMIRALLAGRKTQTRRVLKPQPFQVADGWGCVDRNGAPQKWLPDLPGLTPYIPGERLWVQEDWRTVSSLDRDTPAKMREMALEAGYLRAWAPIEYLADAARYNWESGDAPGRRRWSRHMLREFSRLTLTVTDVRVQRLQEISAVDIAAEGACEFALLPPADNEAFEARTVFHDLWNSLHGPGAWDANPWVCALTFTVHRCNIDQMER